jgi:hypothetical protein
VEERFEIRGAGEISVLLPEVEVGHHRELGNSSLSQGGEGVGEKGPCAEGDRDKGDQKGGWEDPTDASFPKAAVGEVTLHHFANDDAGDEVAGDDEENVDSHVASWKSESGVEENHGDDRKRAKAIDVRSITEGALEMGEILIHVAAVLAKMIVRQRGAKGNVARGASFKDGGKIFRGETIAWTDHAHVFRGEKFTCGDVARGEEGASEAEALFLGFRESVVGGSDRFFGDANCFGHRLEFVWLHGEGAIGSGFVPGAAKVFFNHFGAQGNGRDGDGCAHGVIGEPGADAEALGHVGNAGEVCFLGRSRVGAGAFEKGDFRAASVSEDAHGFLDFLERGHAGGHDHISSGGGDFLKKRMIGQLEGGDFVVGRIELLEEVHRGGIEGRGETVEPVGGRFVENGLMPIPGSVGLGIEVVELLAVPEGAPFYDEGLGIAVEGHRIRGVSLDFYRIGSRLCGEADDFERGVELPVVVSGDLGDEVAARHGRKVID